MKRRKVMFSIVVAALLLVSLIMPASASISPTTLVAELAPGESVSETKTVTIPEVPPRADVVFAFDLTGSMYGIINTAKAQAVNILTALNALAGVDIQYGVMSYMDYNGYYSSCGYADYYGWGSDYPYQLNQAITSNTTGVVSAINGLTLGGGMDGPQDYTRIFYESYADPNVSWRSGARRILVNFGDNVPHDCNLNEGVTEGIWSTGGDPGRDATMGNADDLDLQAVLADMATNGVILLECHTTTYANAYWSYWTGITGGGLYITSSGTLPDDIVEAVEDALEVPVVNGLHLEASTGYESWLTSVSPSSYDGLAPGNEVSFNLTITVPDDTPDGVYNFTISALDGVGVSYGDQEVTITVVSNLPPTADPNGPYLFPLEAGPFDGTASFDPDGDPLTYAWDFGDGNTGTGATPSHTYAEAEIYDVCLTVNDGTVDSEPVCTIAVIYDPSAGFVTGGGWIDSPAGAYTPDPSLTGKATFGFVSKYKKGANAPTGNTEFQFHAADLNFHSSSYEWLVVTGSDYAKFKGVGTINGTGEYKFMIWAGDDEPDTFRIKIWYEENGTEVVVYDNGMDQAIGGGSIVIHTK